MRIHCLNQWLISLLTHIRITRPQWVNMLGNQLQEQVSEVFHTSADTEVLLVRTTMRHASQQYTVYPTKYAHGFCFAVLCCGYTLTDFPISIRFTSLALWQSNDCPSASKATLMNMDKYFMWIHYERLHNHNKAKHNKTVCIFLGIYCTASVPDVTDPLAPLCSRPRTHTPFKVYFLAEMEVN